MRKTKGFLVVEALSKGRRKKYEVTLYRSKVLEHTHLCAIRSPSLEGRLAVFDSLSHRYVRALGDAAYLVY